MPRQLIALLIVAGLLMTPAVHARGKGELSMRGNYYLDTNTRVIQPTFQISYEAETGTKVSGFYLLDAISSASQAFGAVRDEVFTEYRHEGGFAISQQLGDYELSTSYSYSDENDYTAHTITVGGAASFFQDNTRVALRIMRGSDDVGQVGFGTIGHLEKTGLGLTVTQLLHRRLLAQLSFEGQRFSGYQENPYRKAIIDGFEDREEAPEKRNRFSIGGRTKWEFIDNHVADTGYFFYWDSWGVRAHGIDQRYYVELNEHFDLRLQYGFYTQTEADFFEEIYPMGYRGHRTGDPKLRAFDTHLLGLRPGMSLWFLEGVPVLGWFATARIEGGYNYQWQHEAWGNAHEASLAFFWPF